MALLALGAGGLTAWVLDVAASAPSIDELKPVDRAVASRVLASDGSVLGYIQTDAIRDPVDTDDIPDILREATIAIEDENFYEHDGVDVSAVVRAAIENAEAGELKQGGSTITQQLVKNLYLRDPEDTIERKIREAKLAFELEEERSKWWILTEYLNTASYGTNDGRTAVGVEAAAQTYFSKPVTELDLDEAALLAGLPQAPSLYNPFHNPERTKRRRNQVLARMYEEGYITAAQWSRSRSDGLGLERGYKYETIREPYFFDFVRETLIARYGVNRVLRGGLTVRTTIDPRLQALASQAVDDGAARLGGPAVALVTTDVATGEIVAMASSANYASAQYNLAAQGQRQPGSAFKPFVLATAVEQGIDPDSTSFSGASPITLRPDAYTTWTVNNSGEAGAGTLTVTEATTNSTNVVYAQLALEVGPENVAETASALGITSPLDGYPAEAIGGLRVGVSPLEMANAYATFASGGVRHDARAIDRVEFASADGGQAEVDELEDEEGRTVLEDAVAAKVTEILQTVITDGTATAADIGCPAAGKTGTTDDQTDAWFVGYTPRLSTAVWVGYPNARQSMGPSAFGGTYAAPVWRQFMAAARAGYCGDFPEPENALELEPVDTNASPASTTESLETSPTDMPSSSSDAATSPEPVAPGTPQASDSAPSVGSAPGSGAGGASGGVAP